MNTVTNMALIREMDADELIEKVLEYISKPDPFSQQDAKEFQACHTQYQHITGERLNVPIQYT